MTIENTPPANVMGQYMGEAWDDLIGQSSQFFGSDLWKGDKLVGVPFVIVQGTYRQGKYVRADMKGVKADFVFLDLVVGPQGEIDKGVRRGRIGLPVEVEAGEHLGINESGTGVYRQFTSYLEAAGLIKLPAGPEGGAYGESRLDTPVGNWEFDPSVQFTRDPANGATTVAFNVRLYCPRGLRVSEYRNDITEEGRTRYIA